MVDQNVLLAAKKAGTAVIEPIELLELCVQCPATLLRTLLDCMVAGVSVTSLAQLSQKLQGAMDSTGAGERGVLLVYNELLESPGGVQAAVVSALRQPSQLELSAWQVKYLRQVPGPGADLSSLIARQSSVTRAVSASTLTQTAAPAQPAGETHNATISAEAAASPANLCAAGDGSKKYDEMFTRMLAGSTGDTITRDQFASFLRENGRTILGEAEDDEEDELQALLDDMTDEAFQSTHALTRAQFTAFLFPTSDPGSSSATPPAPLSFPAAQPLAQPHAEADTDHLQVEAPAELLFDVRGGGETAGRRDGGGRGEEGQGAQELAAMRAHADDTRAQAVGTKRKLEDSRHSCTQANGKCTKESQEEGNHEGSMHKNESERKAKKKKKKQTQPGSGYACRHCGQQGGVAEAHWHLACPLRHTTIPTSPSDLHVLCGRVTTKKEEGSIAFAIMEEAATGRPSIYVPKNIFVAEHQEDWRTLRVGTALKVKAMATPTRKNKWRATTIILLGDDAEEHIVPEEQQRAVARGRRGAGGQGEGEVEGGQGCGGGGQGAGIRSVRGGAVRVLGGVGPRLLPLQEHVFHFICP